MNPAQVYPCTAIGRYVLHCEGFELTLDPREEDPLDGITAVRARSDDRGRLWVETFGVNDSGELRARGLFPATWRIANWSTVPTVVGESVICVVGPGIQVRLYPRIAPYLDELEVAGIAAARRHREKDPQRLVDIADEAARRASPRAFQALVACARLLEGKEDEEVADASH